MPQPNVRDLQMAAARASMKAPATDARTAEKLKALETRQKDAMRMGGTALVSKAALKEQYVNDRKASMRAIALTSMAQRYGKYADDIGWHRAAVNAAQRDAGEQVGCVLCASWVEKPVDEEFLAKYIEKEERFAQWPPSPLFEGDRVVVVGSTTECGQRVSQALRDCGLDVSDVETGLGQKGTSQWAAPMQPAKWLYRVHGACAVIVCVEDVMDRAPERSACDIITAKAIDLAYRARVPRVMVVSLAYRGHRKPPSAAPTETELQLDKRYQERAMVLQPRKPRPDPPPPQPLDWASKVAEKMWTELKLWFEEPKLEPLTYSEVASAVARLMTQDYETCYEQMGAPAAGFVSDWHLRLLLGHKLELYSRNAPPDSVASSASMAFEGGARAPASLAGSYVSAGRGSLAPSYVIA